MKQYFLNIITDKDNDIVARLLKLVLWLFSFVYQAVIALRRFFYRIGLLKSTDLKVPVISVGNIVMGGTGKTPLVVYIAKYLEGRSKTACVLMRGYMDKSKGEVASASDEAMVLNEKLPKTPILVGSNRSLNAQEFLKNNKTDSFILDDGFQHWQIKRDCDIVVIDALNPFGNKNTIPRGILRERFGALKRAHIFVLARVDLVTEDKKNQISKLLHNYNEGALVVEAAHVPSQLIDAIEGKDLELSILKDSDVVCFSSIGNPDAFERMLKNCGCHLRKEIRFIDHHVYRQMDIDEVCQTATKFDTQIVVTTQKDIVKLKLFLNSFKGKVQVLVLNVELEVLKGETEFRARLDSLL
ncbi:MAG: tetraacyldisaccharide 4'-kinase [Lysobacterales bacterium]|jgi:tetraacyldisaccharide 4'-kinase